jgi:hypothetical protein
MEKQTSNETLLKSENFYYNSSMTDIGIETENNINDYITNLCNISFGCYLRHSITWTIAYLIAYIIVFLIGLIGNLSVLWIIYALRKQKATSSSVSSNTIFYRFVANLALADLLVVSFCLLPTLIGNIFGRK